MKTLNMLPVSVCSAVLAIRAIAAPMLEFSPERLELDELGPVVSVERAVRVRNRGPVPVHVLRVRACCGAKAVPSASEIAPSESAEIRVSLTTGVRPGPFRKTVSVLTDDPERPLFQLMLSGSVREARSPDEKTAVAVAERKVRGPSIPVAAAVAALVFLAVAAIVWAFDAKGRQHACAARIGALLAAAAGLAIAALLVMHARLPRRAGKGPHGRGDARHGVAALPVSSAGAAPLGAAAGRGASKDGEKLTPRELADGNERLNEMILAKELDPGLPAFLASVVSDVSRDEQWRNHCLQFVPECIMRPEVSPEGRALLASSLETALRSRRTVLAGTALLGYARLSERTGRPNADEIGGMAVAIASDASSLPENVVTALRLGAERGVSEMLAPARYWARHGRSGFVRCVAVSAVRDLGGPDEARFLRSLLPAPSKADESAVMNALKAINDKEPL